MKNKLFSTCLLFNLISLLSIGQTITYSEIDRNDVSSANFDIIGKLNNHYLVYKNVRYSYSISLYDNDMKLNGKVKMNFVPDHLLGADFITYDNFFYFIYQYQQKNIITCAAAKIDANGKIIGEPVTLDTTKINFYADSKIYNVLYSEDKQRIATYKLNNKDERNYKFSGVLLDAQLSVLNKFSINIPVQPEKSRLSGFIIDNDGNIVFAKADDDLQPDGSQQISLLIKKPQQDSLNIYSLDVGKIFLNDVRVKADNLNNHFIIVSFYTKSKKGNVDGLYSGVWNKNTQLFNTSKATDFTEDFKNSAKYPGTSSSLNNHHLRNIILRKDGSFTITSESVFSTAYKNIYNTSDWDFTYTDNNNGYLQFNAYETIAPTELYFNGLDTRVGKDYYAYNIVAISFDSAADIEWSSIIRKAQYGDNSFKYLGFGIYLTGGSINFLYNQAERKAPPLHSASIDAFGKFILNPTLKRLDRGYNFMPLFLKQISSHEVVVPCERRDHLCFAKIQF